MKILHLFLILGLALNTACNKDDDEPQNPIDQLPPATQTGEQTFGCLINGEVFLPDNFGSGRPNAFYQFADGAFTLGISASSSVDEHLESVAVGAIDVEPINIARYNLKELETGNYFGRYSIGGGLFLNKITTKSLPGKLTITNFDPENFIISGTFEFTVFDNEGNEIKITNGRFDMLYTN